MKIFLRDLSPLDNPTGTRVRFSVTFADDNGEPMTTIVGFTMDARRRVFAPATKTSSGRYFKSITVSNAFTQKLREALEGMKEVQEILGPEVEGISYQGRQTLDVEAEIFV